MTRTFEDSPAERGKMPLLLGFIGPSGSGKTYSALRVATGMQTVYGGDIHVIDTESRRALHYAPKAGEKVDPSSGRFRFRHLPFGAPFGPLDYLAAFEHCVRKGAKTIICDSMSHEHEGPGGVLEMHASETKRLAALWKCSEYTAQTSAWTQPKGERRRLINSMMQMECNFLLCFRAKKKIKPVKGDSPVDLGYMPIAGEEFVFEMMCKFLLLPGANGVPVTHSEFIGEREMIKIPNQFRAMLSKPEQLSEDTGRRLAEWAAGNEVTVSPVNALLSRYSSCSTGDEWKSLEADRNALWSKATASEKQSLKRASDQAAERGKAVQS